MSTKAGSSGLPVDSATLNAVSSLVLRVRRVVEGLQGGFHRSLHFGASVEFAEHKKYSPGDDTRHMDWRALARTDRYFIKQHQKEVVLRCQIVIDRSASMGYQGSRAEQSKLDYAVELAGAFAYILESQGDEPGVLAFADDCGPFVPPGRRSDHFPALMKTLAGLEPSGTGGTSYKEAFGHAAESTHGRGLIVVISDLWGISRAEEVLLSRLAARGHDVAVFHVLDPDEMDLPFERPTRFEGMEDEEAVNADPALVRDAYRVALINRIERLRRLCGEAGIDFASVVTSSSVSSVLADFASRRQGGRRRG